MKLGFVSAILADETFEEVVDFAATEGFDCVEMMCWPRGKAERRYAGVTHIDVDELGGPREAAINRYLADRGVALSALGYYPNPLDSDHERSAAYVDHIEKVIDAASRLELGVVNTFIGRDHTKSLDYNLKRFGELWPGIVRHAELKNVRIAIENCPMYFTGDEWPGGKNLAVSPAIWRRMFETISSGHFGLNYDPSHMIWQQMDYIAPISEFRDRIFHVHVKDAKLLRARLDDVGILATPLEYHLPKLPGLGDVDWGRFFSALTDIRYNGAVVIEVEDRAYEDTPSDRRRALRQSRDYVRQFVAKE